MEDSTLMAYLESFAIGRTWVYVGAEKVERDDTANSDQGRTHRAGDGHENEYKQTGSGTFAKQRPQHIWRYEAGVHLSGCQSIGVVEPDRSLFDCAGVWADNGSSAPGYGKDSGRHKVICWNSRLHFRSERFLLEGCVHEHKCKAVEL